MKQAILFLTHKADGYIKKRFEKIKKDTKSVADIYIMTDKPEIFDETWGTIVSFNQSDIGGLRNKGILNYDMDLARVGLKKKLEKILTKNYLYYWLIEYDVFFCGNWKDIITIDDSSDLIATHVKKFHEKGQKEWEWWDSFSGPKNFDNKNLLRCFLPLYRISKKGLLVLQNQLDRDSSWSGHFECIIPTVLISNNCTISELGGSSEFTPESRKRKFYKSYPGVLDAWLGTFRWIPLIIIFYQKNVLYHPLKGFSPRIKAFKYMPGMILRLFF